MTNPFTRIHQQRVRLARNFHVHLSDHPRSLEKIRLSIYWFFLSTWGLRHLTRYLVFPLLQGFLVSRPRTNDLTLCLLAGSRWLTRSTQWKLFSRDELPYELLHNPRLVPEIQVCAAKDPRSQVEESISLHPRLVEDAQLILARSENPYVLRMLARHQGLSPRAQELITFCGDRHILDELSRQPYWVPRPGFSVEFLSMTHPGRTFLYKIRDIDPEVYDTLKRDFAGSAEELQALVEDFAA